MFGYLDKLVNIGAFKVILVVSFDRLSLYFKLLDGARLVLHFLLGVHRVLVFVTEMSGRVNVIGYQICPFTRILLMNRWQ